MSTEPQVITDPVRELAHIKYALDEAAIVAITDAQGRIIYVNDTFCQISQYGREELLGKDHRIINSGYHPSSFFHDLWRTISQGKVWKGEICNRAKDGTYYWVDTTIVPFMSENGHPQQYIAIRKDITYLKRMEKELRLLNEGLEARVLSRTAELDASNQELAETLRRLQESERMRETFVSALTHDLRTPLVAERRALELLESNSQALPEKLRGLASRLMKNNEDLLDLVSRLLETYHYESGQIRLIRETIRLSDCLAECLQQLQPMADAAGVRLSQDISPDLFLAADSHQLKRLFTNLLSNAIHCIPGRRYEQNDPPAVTVSAIRERDSVRFRVVDNGPGIDPVQLPHLFERYFVAAQSRKKIGSGLGLSICQMIVRLHGGSIEVESEPGQGTVFIIRLPV